MQDLLGYGTDEYEDEKTNDSVGMQDSTKSNNGDGRVVNDMDLGDDGDARRSLPNIHLIGRTIDYEEDYVEDVLE